MSGVGLRRASAGLAPTGTLRATINLGNPVLAQGTVDEPSGLTVDLAREVAARLEVPLTFACFDAARASFEALRSGRADIGFLAVEPARALEVDFTAPYVVIEGVFAVADISPLSTTDDVDRDGVRIGVKEGSAYDLFLTRCLEHATVVRGKEGVDAFVNGGLEVVAGIRAPMTAYVSDEPGLRLLEPAFMQIQQAVCVPRQRPPEALAYLCEVVEELKASGFVAEALRRSNRSDATVAPPG
ncbi:MAG: transporter substrate-binding domain-containing protein [Humibacillus sp.]|nr:transporter substrate-binding domain-containing protein [Humibacillus sp.]MDN5780386.1 transporter substrate-binding domain-containing protein [Humibacillus sp.]